MSTSNTLSGPNPPHGASLRRGVRAHVTIKSGPNPPHGGFPVTSGPYPPHGGSQTIPRGADAASAIGAATAEATEPKPATREETVGIRLLIPEPEPFSVFILSDDKGGVQIDFIEIQICDEDEPVFTTLLGTDLPVVLDKPAESHVFPFSEEQLAKVLPHLREGNSVDVKIHYLAPDKSQIKIGIIGRDFHHKLGRFIEHLFR